MHGAPYVNLGIARTLGRLGRSWGCPALPTGVAREVIDVIKDGSLVFAYYPDQRWKQTSRFLNPCGPGHPDRRPDWILDRGAPRHQVR